MLVALLGVLSVGVWGAYAVFAAASPPQPTLTSSPANPTNSTSAVFSYSDTQTGVTFACTLDSVAKVCNGSVSAGKQVGTVTLPVAAGSHTFSITASSGGKTSSATSYTWTVDTTAPTVAAAALAGSSPTNAASVSWTVTFSEPVTGVAQSQFALVASGLAGSPAITGFSGSGASYSVTASTGTGGGTLGLNMVSKAGIADLAGNAVSTVMPQPGGVYSVDKVPPAAPSIASGPSGANNPSSATFTFTNNDSAPVTYLCKLDAAAYAACASPVAFSGLADGSHTLLVEAKDAAGNPSTSAASATWSVDATAPPKPTIVGPNNNSASTAAAFTITDSEAGVHYKCQMDGGGYQPCPSNPTYTLLTPGTHVFDAEPIDAAGNIGPFNEWKWTINGNSGSGLNFTITQPALPLLYPGGATDYINLSLTNPNSATIYITSLTVVFSITATHHTGPNACTNADFDLTHLQFSGSYPIVLPHGTFTLSQLGYGQPQQPRVSMLNRLDVHTGDHSGNQDACQNADLNFHYTGSAQS
jgi:hypothetical protein